MVVFDESSKNEMENDADKSIGNRASKEIEYRRCHDVDAHGLHRHASNHSGSGAGEKQRVFLEDWLNTCHRSASDDGTNKLG